MTLNFLKEILNFLDNRKVVFIYVSKEDEPDTRKIIKYLLENEFTVVVPKITGNDIIPVKIDKFNELKTGMFGILEPVSNEIFNLDDIDIFFIPGTLFDKKGNRKGRGKGFFDRFLVDVKGNKPIIGLCYESQVVDELQTNSWDIPVDFLITESKIRSF